MRQEARHVGQATAYATNGDFCRIFANDMNGLYTLALLLTADPDKAEQCFLAAMEDCQRSSRVFTEWAQSWARRAVMQRAIGAVKPEREKADARLLVTRPSEDAQQGRFLLAAVLGLPTFERFVFVMSVLERCSDQDCSAMLSCSRAEVASARARALEHVMGEHDVPGTHFFAAATAMAARTA